MINDSNPEGGAISHHIQLILCTFSNGGTTNLHHQCNLQILFPSKRPTTNSLPVVEFKKRVIVFPKMERVEVMVCFVTIIIPKMEWEVILFEKGKELLRVVEGIQLLQVLFGCRNLKKEKWD